MDTVAMYLYSSIENQVRSEAQLPSIRHRGIYSELKENPSLGTQFQALSVREEKLLKDTRNIQGEFNVLFTVVSNYIVRQGVTVDAFVLFLEGEPGYSDKSLFEAEISDLHKAKDLNSVFRIVKRRCSWFNHSFLANIIKAYCNNNNEIKEYHQDYLKKLHKYCKNRVCSLMNGFKFGSGGKDDHKMIIKVDEKWEEIQIKQLEEVIFDLADKLEVQRHTLHLYTVENGCVQLTLLVANNIPDAVFPLTTEQKEAVREIGVIELHCDTYHLSLISCQVVDYLALSRM